MILGCEILFFALGFVWSKDAVAAEVFKREGPTRIRSDIIDIKRNSETVDFLNNVVVEKDDSSLLANKMTVLYNEKREDQEKASIKRIDAREHVKIFSEEFIASGDFGYYDPSRNIFVLEKNVIVNNGTSIASGKKFVYNLLTKKGNFVGGKDETSITGNGGDKRVVIVIGNDLQDQKKQSKQSKNEQNPQR